MGKTARLTVKLSPRMRQEIRDAADTDGVTSGAFIRACVSKALNRGGARAYMEIPLNVRGGVPYERMMEWLLSRQPVLADVQNGEGDVDPVLRRIIYRVLPSVQARRIEYLLQGMTLETIGHEEGCSKQAVHASIRRGMDTLGGSVQFAAALCEMWPDSGLTPQQLMEAQHGST